MDLSYIEIPNVKEFTIFFFFNLTRKINDNDIELIYNKLHTILSYYKKQLLIEPRTKQIEIIKYELDILLKLVLYTRDYYFGINERKLAFSQLCCWYSVFPRQTIDIIRLFLLGDINHQPFGSWEDVKHLCLYIKNTHYNTSSYSLINIILTITHNETIQLFETTIYNNKNPELIKTYFISNNLLLNTTSININSISSPESQTKFKSTKLKSNIHNLSHNIPPESSKKYNWIFNILAEMWGEYSFNYNDKINITHSTTIKQTNKYKMVYRRTLQLLKKNNVVSSIPNIPYPSIKPINNTDFIPIIDISAFSIKNNTSDTHKHIDILKYISNFTCINKILCVDNIISIIDTQNIDTISTLPNNTYPDYFKAINLIIDTIKNCNLSNQDIKMLKLVFISNLGINETKPVIIYNYLLNKFKYNFYGTPLPTIVFWNNSNENTPYFYNTQITEHYFTNDGENIIFNDNIIFTSGLSAYSNSVLKPNIKNTYQHILDILNEDRYTIQYTTFK